VYKPLTVAQLLDGGNSDTKEIKKEIEERKSKVAALEESYKVKKAQLDGKEAELESFKA